MTGPTPIAIAPCEPWLDGAAAAECCPDLASSDLTLLDQAAAEASALLYPLSGHRFPGLCERTVRPHNPRCQCWQVLSRGHIIGPWDISWDGSVWTGSWGGQDFACGCWPLSRITLTGYVREILEVTIDGNTLDAAEYRLDRHRYLTRLADPDGTTRRWPHCQRLDIDQGPGTFFVTYLYGLEPPAAGVAAAAQLACELAKACATPEDCELPRGTVRVTRQGITVDTQTLGLWLLGTQRTGMDQVDAFLHIHGRAPTRRVAALYTPELDPFPLPVEQ